MNVYKFRKHDQTEMSSMKSCLSAFNENAKVVVL